ncbi:MAG TPA: DUF6221 family protein, partial [Trebonia sp.]
GMMDELIAFVRARLGEDEAAAAAASDGPWTAWRGQPGLGLRQLEYAVTLPGQNSGSFASIATASWMDAEHIARHDPARVLREVEAKRAILAQIAPWMDSAEDDHWYERGVGEQPPYEGSVLLMKLLAAVWGGHPDYRSEWKP